MRLRKDAKVDLLRGIPLFAQCSKRVLIEGAADVLKSNRKVASLKAGDFFGEIALVHHAPRTATVRASSPVRALVIMERDFKRLLDEQPEIQRKVLVALAERLEPTTL